MSDKLKEAINKLRKFGSELPDNPTLDDWQKEAFRLAQAAKGLVNSGQIPHEKRDKFLRALGKLEGPYLDKKK